ncbi:MAG: enoyl-CoA hydratase-related protein [Peptococcaceae bacterium]|jgi:2-(1,2-epoxy-1,2-dihydrophenyl)acetyl-CoA isomerase|nr:enoyl-CoA hydratase-related protein [Peptococcaceae bacterium]
MAFTEIDYDLSAGIGTITLNRPDNLNALTRAMGGEIIRAVTALGEDDGCRVVVMRGAGRAFCAGGDIKTMAGGLTATAAREYVQKTGEAILTLHRLEKPVLAVVGGWAMGSGCNLALAADLVIASREARFGQVFAQVGLTVDGGSSFFLPRLIGMARAKELVLTGRIIDAAEALAMGLINKVVPGADLEAEAAALAGQLAQGPTYALGMAKTLLNAGFQFDLEGALAQEALAQGICLQTGDHREGLAAFQAKRPPRFAGR